MERQKSAHDYAADLRLRPRSQTAKADKERADPASEQHMGVPSRSHVGVWCRHGRARPAVQLAGVRVTRVITNQPADRVSLVRVLVSRTLPG
jgi:hypothetical protein